jgi:hypothetical protein
MKMKVPLDLEECSGEQRQFFRILDPTELKV